MRLPHHAALLLGLATLLGVGATPLAEARPDASLRPPGPESSALSLEAPVVQPSPSLPELPAVAPSMARIQVPPALAEAEPGQASLASAPRLQPVEADLSAEAAPDERLWSGTVQAEGARLRQAPRRDAPVLAELAGGTAVRVRRWVQGDEVLPDNPVWAERADGGYLYSATLRHGPLPELPAPAVAPLASGRWIDVDVTRQVLTAYEGATPVRTLLVSTGRPGWDTPLGTFQIGRRVESETMDAATLAGQVPPGQAPPRYRIEHVRYAQYFTTDGAAFHENTWRDAQLFGVPGSHGCVSLRPGDAAWLWSWASSGTPVRVHR